MSALSRRTFLAATTTASVAAALPAHGAAAAVTVVADGSEHRIAPGRASSC
ncbi:hypothetical protein AB0K48_49650 [Nonomuraea sp. NPDC055795]